MRYLPIDKALFIENRKKLVKAIKPNSIAIFHSNDQMPKTGDQHYTFKQNPDLFYLTGIAQEQTILLLYPDCHMEKYREVLFVRQTNEHLAVWEGHKYTKEEATRQSGIETVLWSEEFNTILNMVVFYADNICLNLNEHDRFSTTVPYRELRFAHEMKEKYPLHNYERMAPVMTRLRQIKSDTEIQLMQEACNITEKGFRRVLGFIKPGVMEYEIEAELIHEYISNRANGFAYDPIVASGANSCVLHYVTNNQQCKDGDILLMDVAAEYANYSSDLTRTVPVNGRYTERQKQVYNAVLNVQKEAIDMLRPGITLEEYNKEIGKVMEKELIRIGLLDKHEVEKQDEKNPLFRKYFMHGTAHFIGLDTHDVGIRNEPVKEGMVFTCEPGIYLRDEAIGVRIENNILVTAEGPVDLMKNIPREVGEIEDLMNS